MSLPGQFISTIESMQNFRKSPIRILPNSTASEVKSSGFIKFLLPVGCVLDMKTLAMHFTAKTQLDGDDPKPNATAGTARVVGFPKYMQSLIQTFEVAINGKNVTQISEYGRVYALLQSFKHNRDRKLANNFDPSVYSFLDNTGTLTTLATKNVGGGTTDPYTNACRSQGEYVIDEWLGFLNGSPNILDTNVLGQIEITLRLYNANNILWGNTGVNSGALVAGDGVLDFILSNIMLYVDKIDFRDEKYVNSISSLVSSEGGLKIAFKNYTYYNGDATTNNKNNTMKITESTQCLDKIIYTYYDNTAAAIAGRATLQLGDHTSAVANYNANSSQLLNSSIYFRRNGLGIGTVEVELNSQSITQPLPLTNQWQETLKAFSQNESDSLEDIEPGLRDLNHYQKDFYVFALSTSHINSKNKNAIVMSGIDTQASSLNIQVKSVQSSLGTNVAQAGMPVIITEMTSFIQVNGQRQIMFVR
jgi:hypothetical protein